MCRTTGLSNMSKVVFDTILLHTVKDDSATAVGLMACQAHKTDQHIYNRFLGSNGKVCCAIGGSSGFLSPPNRVEAQSIDKGSKLQVIASANGSEPRSCRVLQMSVTSFQRRQSSVAVGKLLLAGSARPNPNPKKGRAGHSSRASYYGCVMLVDVRVHAL